MRASGADRPKPGTDESEDTMDWKRALDRLEICCGSHSSITNKLGAPVSYRFPFEVEEARFVERPNRFLVIAERHREGIGTTGELVRVHCPDPGRLRELLVPDARLFISPNRVAGSTRRTQYDLRFVLHAPPERSERVLISLDTRLPNRLIGLALADGAVHLFRGPQQVSAEVAGPLPHAQGVQSRFDFRVSGGDGAPWWVEVKSVTLVEDGVALFPDAPTARGRRHLEELTTIMRQGEGRAAVIFVVQRPDAHALAAHVDRDPAFAHALAAANHAGVQICAVTCALSTEAITLERVISVRL